MIIDASRLFEIESLKSVRLNQSVYDAIGGEDAINLYKKDNQTVLVKLKNGKRKSFR